MHSRKVSVSSLEDVLGILEMRGIYYNVKDDINPMYSIITVEADDGFNLDEAIDTVKLVEYQRTRPYLFF